MRVEKCFFFPQLFTENSKNMFSFCHSGLLSVHGQNGIYCTTQLSVKTSEDLNTFWSNYTCVLPRVPVLPPAFIFKIHCQQVEGFFALHCLCYHGSLSLPISLPEGILGKTDREESQMRKIKQTQSGFKGQQCGEMTKTSEIEKVTSDRAQNTSNKSSYRDVRIKNEMC